MFTNLKNLVFAIFMMAVFFGCTPTVRLPPVHEPLESEEWKKCAADLAEQESTTMIADLTLDAKTMLCQGVVLAATGKVDEALELLNESAAKDKEDHRPHYLAGRILAENGRYEEALTEFERAHKRFSSIEIPTQRIGRELVKEKKEDEARVFLAKAFERDLCSYECKGLYAKLLGKADDDDKARSVYKKMIKEDPAEPGAYVGLAGIANRAGEYSEEAKFLEKAQGATKFKELSKSQKADVFYSMAFARYNSAEYADAAKAIKEATFLTNDRADWFVLAGWIDLKRTRYETALAAFKKAEALDRKLAASYTGEGDSRMALNEPDAARTAFAKAMDLDPTNAVIILKLAHCAAILGDLDAARLLVDEAARLDKDHLPPELLKKVTDLLSE